MARLAPLFRSGHGIAFCMSMLMCCGLSLGKEACPPYDFACLQVYTPVCGEDGQTYTNACTAEHACVKVVSQGECGVKIPPKPSCGCIKIYKPVCGRDGMTYANSCVADCNGAVVDHDGKCDAAKPTMPVSTPTPTAAPSRSCGCTKEYIEVCGAGGKRYPNKCVAKCNGETDSSLIECPRLPDTVPK